MNNSLNRLRILPVALLVVSCGSATSPLRMTEAELSKKDKADEKLLRVNDLQEVLRTSKDWEIRMWAIFYLGTKGTEDSMESLVEVCDKDPKLAPFALMTLTKASRRFTSESFVSLASAAALRHLDPSNRPAVQREAILLLESFHQESSALPIMDVLKQNPGWTIKKQVFLTLSRLNPKLAKQAAKQEFSRLETQKEEIRNIVGE